MSHKCIFCGEVITPEEAWQDSRHYIYNYQCENPLCQAEYDSHGRQIPDITVRSKPIMRIEITGEERFYVFDEE